MTFFNRSPVYLDYNATTPVSKEVRRTINRVLKSHWGNPSSGYQSGRTAYRIVEQARERVANAIGAHTHEIYFSSCATEANNTIIKILCNKFISEKKKIITIRTEHSSVLKTIEYQINNGLVVDYCPVDRFGFVDITALEKMIDSDTFLVCISLANNETGTIQNIKAISSILKGKEILLMSDCVQAMGKIALNVRELGLNYATFSAHKIYGPKGIGAFYVRGNSHIESFIHGGQQEDGIRAGTEAVHNIAGFGRACLDIDHNIRTLNKTYTLKLEFCNLLLRIKPDAVIRSPSVNCLMNTLSVTLPGVNSKELMMMLDSHGISVSSGSACNAMTSNPSHVLTAMGLDPAEAMETIRFSLGKNTTRSEINYTIKVISKYLKEVSN